MRKARQRKGITRRVLSDLSGVSQRYLAQLENGDGNISIGLLYRVAQALDHRVEWLVGEDDPWGIGNCEDRRSLSQRLRRAAPESHGRSSSRAIRTRLRRRRIA